MPLIRTKYEPSDFCVSPKLFGVMTSQVPFGTNTSAMRRVMVSKHKEQAVPIVGAEFPQIFSGKEKEYGSYEITTSESDRGRRVLDVIYKYPPNHGGMFRVSESPLVTVVYADDERGEIGYFDLPTYTIGSNHFGYENKQLNRSYLERGVYLPPEMKFSTSPLHDGSKYCPGVNLRVALMAHPDTAEDAIVISRSTARNKLLSYEVSQVTVNVKEDQYLANKYGDEFISKPLPDIGDKVGDDGCLCILRNTTKYSIISDIYGDDVNLPRLQDEMIYVPKGAVILDVDMVPGRYDRNDPRYAQVEHYTRMTDQYYQKIYRSYLEHCRGSSGLKPTPAYNTRVTTAIKRLIVAGERIPNVDTRQRPGLVDRDKPIRHLQFTVTYIAPRSLVPTGNKVTNRYGGLGHQTIQFV